MSGVSSCTLMSRARKLATSRTSFERSMILRPMDDLRSTPFSHATLRAHLRPAERPAGAQRGDVEDAVVGLRLRHEQEAPGSAPQLPTMMVCAVMARSGRRPRCSAAAAASAREPSGRCPSTYASQPTAFLSLLFVFLIIFASRPRPAMTQNACSLSLPSVRSMCTTPRSTARSSPVNAARHHRVVVVERQLEVAGVEVAGAGGAAGRAARRCRAALRPPRGPVPSPPTTMTTDAPRRIAVAVTSWPGSSSEVANQRVVPQPASSAAALTEAFKLAQVRLLRVVDHGGDLLALRCLGGRHVPTLARAAGGAVRRR